jgi:tetratricopeptide (TPR) repeat protein|tara:strand:+ start:226 stop:528 length:303 start_codon:yes stop_codon:yes gene_type:complete
MSDRSFHNIYNLSDQQLEELDKAEEMLEFQHLNSAEELLLRMLEKSPDCVPVLNNLGVLYGKYFLEYEKAISYYNMVLKIEPSNEWARNERRRYERYVRY